MFKANKICVLSYSITGHKTTSLNFSLKCCENGRFENQTGGREVHPENGSLPVKTGGLEHLSCIFHAYFRAGSMFLSYIQINH